MLGRHTDAIQCLEKALSLDPSIADAWVVMSNSCFMIGRLEESARAFDQTVEALRCLSDVLGILLR